MMECRWRLFGTGYERLSLVVVFAVSLGCQSGPTAEDDESGSAHERAEAELEAIEEDVAAAFREHRLAATEEGEWPASLEAQTEMLDRRSAAKREALRSLKSRLEGVIRYEDEPTATEALYHVARLYLNFTCEQATFPTPERLGSCQRQEYLERVFRNVRPTMEMAREHLGRASEVGVGPAAGDVESLRETLERGVAEGERGAFALWNTCRKTQSHWTTEAHGSHSAAPSRLTRARVSPGAVEFGLSERFSKPREATVSVDDPSSYVPSIRKTLRSRRRGTGFEPPQTLVYVHAEPTVEFGQLATTLYALRPRVAANLAVVQIGSGPPMPVALPAPTKEGPFASMPLVDVSISVAVKYDGMTFSTNPVNGTEGTSVGPKGCSLVDGASPVTDEMLAEGVEPAAIAGRYDWTWLREQFGGHPPAKLVETSGGQAAAPRGIVSLGLDGRLPAGLVRRVSGANCGENEGACRVGCTWFVMSGDQAGRWGL